MVMLAIRDNLDGLSDEMKKEYKEHNGKFLLDVEAVDNFDLQDIKGLRSSLEAARGERDQAVLKLKPFEGLDVVKARDALKTVAEYDGSDASAKAQKALETQTAEIKAKSETDIKAANQRADKYRKQTADLSLDYAVRKALGEHKLMPKAADVLLPIVQKQVKIEESEDGTLKTTIINPETGHTRLSMKPDNTGPMQMDELIDGIKGDYSYLFASTDTSGTGAKTNTTGTPRSDGKPEITGKNVNAELTAAFDYADKNPDSP